MDSFRMGHFSLLPYLLELLSFLPTYHHYCGRAKVIVAWSLRTSLGADATAGKLEAYQAAWTSPIPSILSRLRTRPIQAWPAVVRTIR